MFVRSGTKVKTDNYFSDVNLDSPTISARIHENLVIVFYPLPYGHGESSFFTNPQKLVSVINGTLTHQTAIEAVLPMNRSPPGNEIRRHF
jgi:hypothetical protein